MDELEILFRMIEWAASIEHLEKNHNYQSSLSSSQPASSPARTCSYELGLRLYLKAKRVEAVTRAV